MRGGVSALREKNAGYLYIVNSVPIRTNERRESRLGFARARALVRSLFARGTYVRRKRFTKGMTASPRAQPILRPPSPPPSPLPPATHPVISSCTKLVKIPPVCPSLQPAQCGNHLTRWKARAGEREGRREQGGENAAQPLDSSSVPAFSSLDGRDTAKGGLRHRLSAVCHHGGTKKLFIRVQRARYVWRCVRARTLLHTRFDTGYRARARDTARRSVVERDAANSARLISRIRS